ncbi:glycoside hydrolase family 10 protein [Alistipes sp. ZOR0009]|uniref:glycoside hydrolase family 10 protein n=1 Tax=Alistipes sp. ZOR0009 TaxID=1339253 RepID=UPI000647FF50|nr:family 10 glycosylhydrolase [Alistipes sp. ZOR0009]
MKKVLTLVFTLVTLISTCLAGPAKSIAPKREMRAAWIASVENIDWPSKAGLSAEEQKKELTALVEKLNEVGINTIVLQIRPYGDALYESKIEPWSKYLTGKQGVAPQSGFDPLSFMIEECHKRYMELHAWFNPYRVAKTDDAEVNAQHVSRKHPEWLVTYGKLKVLDPGLPQTREYVTQVIMDVVRRYDVDGIHLDDYFYPYKIKGVEFNDKSSFAAHSRGFKPSQKNDWRRDNVNLIIKMLADSIHAAKPYVKFGVSPFGIWRNKKSDARGSETNGGQNYDDLYADILLWLQNRWVDYIVPQLYWHIGMKSANYETLAKWWAANCHGVPLYIGQGVYKIDAQSKDKAWADGKEIARQITLNRSIPQIQGSFFYSAKSFMQNPMGLNSKLKKEFYRYPALIPTTPRLDSIAPAKPTNLVAKKGASIIKLSWAAGDSTATDGEKSRYYVVYRFDDDDDLNNPANIYTITRDTSITLKRRQALERGKVRFCVTALDRLSNESEPTEKVTVRM